MSAAGSEPPDVSHVGVELIRLRRREVELLRHLERSKERLAFFPSGQSMREVLRLMDEHDQLRARMEELKALLFSLPLRLK